MRNSKKTTKNIVESGADITTTQLVGQIFSPPVVQKQHVLVLGQ